MAVNLDAIRRKLNQLSGGGSRRDSMWRPEEGKEYTVRLLAFPDNEGQPFKELWFYYNVGNNPGLLAPHQFGKPDPIQDLINKLRAEGSKESYELAKKLYPKMRAYAPVVVRGEEDKGVRIWSFGKTVLQDIYNIMLDEDYGDITDALEGRDVRVMCTKAPGKQYADTKVTARAKISKLNEDQKKAKEWLGTIPNLLEMYPLKTEQELENIVNAWLNGDQGSPESSASSNEDEGASRGGSSKVSNKSETDDVAAKYKSLDDAFADLE